MAFPKLSTSQTLSVNRSADLRQSQTPRSGHIVASLLIDIVWILLLQRSPMASAARLGWLRTWVSAATSQLKQFSGYQLFLF
ncbi:MAG: hypothetical protein HC886_11195 [Leptolyngbyaceae cyanobacterium SM1_1_3]|nr:hypothetical protein [Leptolyngbyaceae cyanobacterium SM1_1_3]